MRLPAALPKFVPPMAMLVVFAGPDVGLTLVIAGVGVGVQAA